MMAMPMPSSAAWNKTVSFALWLQSGDRMSRSQVRRRTAADKSTKGAPVSRRAL